MRPFAAAFYKSAMWEHARDAAIQRAGGLCEACLAKGICTPGIIVHHKTHLDPENINDVNVLTAPENLELLCRRCHGEAHGGKRYRVDDLGRVIF